MVLKTSGSVRDWYLVSFTCSCCPDSYVVVTGDKLACDEYAVEKEVQVKAWRNHHAVIRLISGTKSELERNLETIKKSSEEGLENTNEDIPQEDIQASEDEIQVCDLPEPRPSKRRKQEKKKEPRKKETKKKVKPTAKKATKKDIMEKKRGQKELQRRARRQQMIELLVESDDEVIPAAVAPPTGEDVIADINTEPMEEDVTTEAPAPLDDASRDTSRDTSSEESHLNPIPQSSSVMQEVLTTLQDLTKANKSLESAIRCLIPVMNRVDPIQRSQQLPASTDPLSHPSQPISHLSYPQPHQPLSYSNQYSYSNQLPSRLPQFPHQPNLISQPTFSDLMSTEPFPSSNSSISSSSSNDTFSIPIPDGPATVVIDDPLVRPSCQADREVMDRTEIPDSTKRNIAAKGVGWKRATRILCNAMFTFAEMTFLNLTGKAQGRKRIIGKLDPRRIGLIIAHISQHYSSVSSPMVREEIGKKLRDVQNANRNHLMRQ